MSNPYIVGSKLAVEEVKDAVWKLVWFRPYAEIIAEQKRSPQALRPILARIERRMYFELDGWAWFHMIEFHKFNLNKNFRPYTDHMAWPVRLINHIPRSPVARMKIEGDPVEFASEIQCLFDCPQHLPPRQFTEEYGKVNPLQNFDMDIEREEVCWNRIALKKHCLKCKSKLASYWTDKLNYYFRYAMEYAAEWGKPRDQYADLFIARMVYYLVWRGYELNLRAWNLQRQLVLRKEGTKMSEEQGEEHYQQGFRKANEEMQGLYGNIKRHLAHLVLNDLANSPMRIDRRGAHQT